MLKNDLVLRGSVDSVELLIFPSNILSKNFQSKNSWTSSIGVISHDKFFYTYVFFLEEAQR
jgi:hypothetical protein